MNSHHAKRTLKESMGYKVFAVFMAFTPVLAHDVDQQPDQYASGAGSN